MKNYSKVTSFLNLATVVILAFGAAYLFGVAVAMAFEEFTGKNINVWFWGLMLWVTVGLIRGTAGAVKEIIKHV